jgi:hypothetical protein
LRKLSNWNYSKKKKITGLVIPSVGSGIEQLEHLCTTGGNVKLSSHLGDWAISYKLNIHFSYGLIFPLLSLYPREENVY